jgi:peptidoglycan/LPS O-acetylase OafA/YrhL
MSPFLIASPGAFRLILALAVVLNHLTVVQSGRGAVLLFFVLSGYWVADLWAKTPASHRMATFYLNRGLRIWPLYMAVMLICAVAIGHSPGFFNLFLIGVASQPTTHLVGTEWSLDIEVQFYALLPLFAALANRFDRLGWTLLVFGIAFVGWQIEATSGVVTVFKYLPFFAIGMAIQQTRWKPTVSQGQASLLVFLLITIIQIYLSQTQGTWLHTEFHAWADETIASIWVVTLIPYVATSLHRPSDARDRMLGDLSYPLYLVHAPVVLASGLFFSWRTLPGVMALIVLIAVATMLAYWLIDRPAERLRKGLLSRTRKAGYRAASA